MFVKLESNTFAFMTKIKEILIYTEESIKRIQEQQKIVNLQWLELIESLKKEFELAEQDLQKSTADNLKLASVNEMLAKQLALAEAQIAKQALAATEIPTASASISATPVELASIAATQIPPAPIEAMPFETAPIVNVPSEAILPQVEPAVIKTNTTPPPSTGSLNDQFKIRQPELADKLNFTAIEDLKSAINMNDRIAFTQNLFEGNSSLFNKALLEMNHASSLAHAVQIFNNYATSKWSETPMLVEQFKQLLKRRFPNPS